MTRNSANSAKGKKNRAIPTSTENWDVHDIADMSAEEVSNLIIEGRAIKPKSSEKPAVQKKTVKASIKSTSANTAEKPSENRTKKPAKAKLGRPSTYSLAIVDEIVARISTGEPLRQICRDEHMPAWRTVYDWQEAHKDFYARIAHARELGEEAIAQECLDIADDAQNDWMEKHGRDGNEFYQLNGEHVQRSKLRIETRLKLLAKWNPRKWGEKVDLNHGVQPDNPLMTVIQRVAGTGLPIVKDKPE